MRPTYRLPLAVLGGAALIAGVLALKPSANTPGAPPPAQAAPAATDPGALVPYLRFSGYGSVHRGAGHGRDLRVDGRHRRLVRRRARRRLARR